MYIHCTYPLHPMQELGLGLLYMHMYTVPSSVLLANQYACIMGWIINLHECTLYMQPHPNELTDENELIPRPRWHYIIPCHTSVHLKSIASIMKPYHTGMYIHGHELVWMASLLPLVGGEGDDCLSVASLPTERDVHLLNMTYTDTLHITQRHLSLCNDKIDMV